MAKKQLLGKLNKRQRKRAKRQWEKWTKYSVFANKKGWNHNLTPKENYEKLGLMVDPNDIKVLNEVESTEDVLGQQKRMLHKNKARIRMIKKKIRKAEDTVPEMVDYTIKPPQETEEFLSDHRKTQLAKLIERHGTDFEKMSRDIRLNYLQETALALQKDIEKFYRIEMRLEALERQEENNETGEEYGEEDGEDQ